MSARPIDRKVQPRAPSATNVPFPISPIRHRKAQTARRSAVEPMHRAIPVPVQPGAREDAGRSRDVLLDEHSKGRITEAQFLIGRMIQTAFERGSSAGLGSVDWSRVGAIGSNTAHELAMILRVEDADRLRKFSVRMEREIGRAGVRFLQAILVGDHSFTSYAASEGRSGNSGMLCIGDRFRWLLGQLVEARQTATGPAQLPIRAETY